MKRSYDVGFILPSSIRIIPSPSGIGQNSAFIFQRSWRHHVTNRSSPPPVLLRLRPCHAPIRMATLLTALSNLRGTSLALSDANKSETGVSVWEENLLNSRLPALQRWRDTPFTIPQSRWLGLVTCAELWTLIGSPSQTVISHLK